MPAPKSRSDSAASGSKPRRRSATKAATNAATKAATNAATKAAAQTGAETKRTTKSTTSSRQSEAVADGATEGDVGARDHIASRLLHPLDLVLLTRDRIQDTLDEFAERGRVTRDDANELVAELVRRGREQTDDILGDVEQLLGYGRDQVEAATKKARRTDPVDRIVRTADRARRTVGVGPAFPILGYEDLTVGQVEDRLGGLTPPQLRKVRDYERRHANRKTVLEAIEVALS